MVYDVLGNFKLLMLNIKADFLTLRENDIVSLGGESNAILLSV